MNHVLFYRLRTGVDDDDDDEDDKGLSDGLIRMRGNGGGDHDVWFDGDDDDDGDWGACHDGGRLAYLCCAWQYSALSS